MAAAAAHAKENNMAPLVLAVAQDGSADYRTVQEAVDAVPPRSNTRTVIRIAPGVYRQPVYVPKDRYLITFAGIQAENTVLSWDNTSEKIDHHQDSTVIGTGTFACGTVIVEGPGFIAENITFENTWGPDIQAVAVRVTADHCAFYNCRFLGWQDTLYLHFGKNYLSKCYVEGDVDFIFGNSTALLEHCHIHCKAAGFITAQSRTSPEGTTGYVFSRCVITGNGEKDYIYLGRPWGYEGNYFSRVVFVHTYIDACVRPAGWNNWDDPEREKTAFFAEYKCFGPGSSLSQRVTWAKKLDDEEAEQFLAHEFVDPDQQEPWLDIKLGVKVPRSAKDTIC